VFFKLKKSFTKFVDHVDLNNYWFLVLASACRTGADNAFQTEKLIMYFG